MAHGSLLPIQQAFIAAEVQDKEIYCKDRWGTLYAMLIKYAFAKSLEQVERWRMKGILTQGGADEVTKQITLLQKSRPTSIG